MTLYSNNHNGLLYHQTLVEESAAESLGGQKDTMTTSSERKTLGLLDLPLDILQAICKEFTHTNDFTAVALTHSALYDLVIPQIYSRFDIVWPDASPTTESRMGVDALTYGLATLVMAPDVFGEAQYQQSKYACQKCGHQNVCAHQQANVRKPRRVRRGNHYAQYTKKFSLGNGPEDWVREYLITKESGKMLGTLVALAIGRMRNLEVFTWDMPTGVLRDVWLALASLAERDHGRPCKLERLWIRWHDNSENMPAPPPAAAGMVSVQSTDLPSLLTSTVTSLFQMPPYPRVEFPTFSILPPLKSLNVLDIDELSYVEEMSVLIEASLDRLQELRIGVARHAQYDPWARPQENNDVQPPSLMDVAKPVLRPGGLLGILVGRFCTSFSSPRTITPHTLNVTNLMPTETEHHIHSGSKETAFSKPPDRDNQHNPGDMNQLTSLLSAQSIEDVTDRPDIPSTSDAHRRSCNANPVPMTASNGADSLGSSATEAHSKRLKLEVLELERVCLSIPVLSRAFDWTKLVSLTLLGCRNHDQLWKALRRKFTPVSHRRTSSMTTATTSLNSLLSPRSVSGPLLASVPASDFNLKITRIHTDTVSNAFLAFIKDTLAPDTLEWLFLQHNDSWKSTVTIEQIYKYTIRPHRSSIRNLLINSDTRTGADSSNPSWRRWSLSKDLITCITSGRMQLRELSMSIDYKDWHYFLQRLPNAATLRSLHIPHIADHINGRFDSRDTAQQILDVVALRPELELCYVGIQSKCFEILELPSNRCSSPLPRADPNITETQPLNDDDDDLSDDHDDHDNDDEEEEEEEDHDSEIDSDHDDDFDISEDEEAISIEDQKPTFRLREILFYDDRIAIFKARHGKL